jgi:hypothetical protein
MVVPGDDADRAGHGPGRYDTRSRRRHRAELGRHERRGKATRRRCSSEPGTERLALWRFGRIGLRPTRMRHVAGCRSSERLSGWLSATPVYWSSGVRRADRKGEEGLDCGRPHGARRAVARGLLGCGARRDDEIRHTFLATSIVRGTAGGHDLWVGRHGVPRPPVQGHRHDLRPVGCHTVVQSRRLKPTTTSLRHERSRSSTSYCFWHWRSRH